MISRKRGDDIYIGGRPQKKIRKKQDAGGGTMPSPKKTEYTLEDIYALPDGQRAELISGQLYRMAPPSTRHQRLVNFLTTEINLYIRKKQGRCEVLPAPFAVFLEDANGNENLVEPDISVICDPEKIDEKGCHGAPDWVIEIVSPSSKSIDYGRKQALYLLSGVREYWIVDPIRESAVIYRAAEDWIPMFYRFGDSLKAGIYEDLEIVIE